MAKTDKGAGDAGKNAADQPFETTLQKLQAIVESMETEDLPLETLLSRYEEGTKLAQICQRKLAEAELKIQRLEKANTGEVRLRPMAPPDNETHE